MNNTYSVSNASKLDREVKQLMSMYSAAKIKTGFEMAKRLQEIESGKLYLMLDKQSYPTFARYLQHVDIAYKAARELISLYECYIVVAGFTVDEMSSIAYHRLSTIKPILFKKQDGKYHAIKSKKEIKEWISDAKSSLSLEDLRLKKSEESVGKHPHKWDTVSYKKCRVCKIKEYGGTV